VVKVRFPENAPEKEIINLCSNNYLGLSSHPDVIAAAHAGLNQRGYGLSSVRFICGTQDIHRELEKKIAAFLGMEDAILFSSCFDANAALFEALLTDQDAIFSDRLIMEYPSQRPWKFGRNLEDIRTLVPLPVNLLN
jgi:glycine C-acetyltransferase